MECKKPILVGKVRHKQRLVPCGKCAQCKANLRAEWCGRLSVENYHSRHSYFATLTYSDDNLQVNNYGVPSVWKDHVQRFMKRVRKEISIRYFCTSEYGSKTLRPHYHVLFFTNEDIEDFDFYKIIEKHWHYGSAHFGKVEPASIAYCTKYCMKDSKMLPEANKPFRLISRFPPIGSQITITEAMLGTFNFYGQRFKTSRLMRDKYLVNLDDAGVQLKAYAETRQRQRAQASFAKWCRTNNRDINDIAAMIDYGLYKQECAARLHELSLKHIKEETI